jgi:uncharacterized protein YjbI with pentapeptide repeats
MRADLSGAKLYGADLTGATGVTPAQIASVEMSETTKLPEGYLPGRL